MQDYLCLEKLATHRARGRLGLLLSCDRLWFSVLFCICVLGWPLFLVTQNAEILKVSGHEEQSRANFYKWWMSFSYSLREHLRVSLYRWTPLRALPSTQIPVRKLLGEAIFRHTNTSPNRSDHIVPVLALPFTPITLPAHWVSSKKSAGQSSTKKGRAVAK